MERNFSLKVALAGLMLAVFSPALSTSPALAGDGERHDSKIANKMMARCQAKGNSQSGCRKRMEKHRAKMEKRCAEKGLSKQECIAKIKEKYRKKRQEMKKKCHAQGLSREECKARMKKQRKEEHKKMKKGSGKGNNPATPEDSVLDL